MVVIMKKTGLLFNNDGSVIVVNLKVFEKRLR